MLQPRMFSSVARLTTLPYTMFDVSTDPCGAVRQAVQSLNIGEVIAVPTDTVYGLAASAQNEEAIKLLYKIKARDEKNPVAVCVSKVADICRIGETSHIPEGLLKKLLPGPVTVVLRRTNYLNSCVNPGNELIGIRVPNDAFIRNVVYEFGKPIALTSANTSRQPSSLSTVEFKDLWPKLGVVFDGGIINGSRKASTVIDLSNPGSYSVLREGCALFSTEQTLKEHNLINSK